MAEMKDAPTSENRRSAERLPKTFRVEIGPLKLPLMESDLRMVSSVNVSEGGLLVECDQSFPVGEVVRVRVHIPSLNKHHPGMLKCFESDVGQYLQALAEVVRSEFSGGSALLGLKFVNVDPDDVQALRHLIGKALAAA